MQLNMIKNKINRGTLHYADENKQESLTEWSQTLLNF